MTYTAKEYNVFIDKKTHRIVGKVIDVPSSMEDMYEEVELPESFKRLIDKFNEIKNQTKTE